MKITADDSSSVQDQFIENLIKANETVSLFLKSGVQLKGVIVGYDPLTITLSYNNNLQLVYKHAIATICPHIKD